MPEDTDGQPRPYTLYCKPKPTVAKTRVLFQQTQVGINASVRIDPMTSPPYNWIARLEIDFGADPISGSGFKISLPDMKYTVVVTAGHCIYNKDFGFARKITATFPDKEPVIIESSARRKFFSVHPKYINHQDSDYDYGFILLDGNSDDGFGWSTEMTSEDLNNCIVTVCGFPEDKPKGSMWITGGEISRATDRHILYGSSTTSGQSGSPVYTNGRGAWMVVAVHTSINPQTSQGFGVRLVFQMISHIMREAGIEKVIKSRKFTNLSIQYDGERVRGQYTSSVHDDQKFYVYPVKMLPSLLSSTKPSIVVIESFESKGFFIKLDDQTVDHPKKSGGGVVNCQKEPGKFYLKNEGGSDVSFVSVDYLCCRIRLDGSKFLGFGVGGTVTCQCYANKEEPASHSESSFARFQIVCEID